MSWKRSTPSMLALLAVAAGTAVFSAPSTAHAQVPSGAAPSGAAPSKAAPSAAAPSGVPSSGAPSSGVPSSKVAPRKAEQIKRGEYLVTIGGCNDCHTPMKMTPIGLMPDFERRLMGHPADAPDPTGTPGKTDLALTGSDLTSWKMPYGLVYSRNITPDKSGLGDWTEAQFIKSMRIGRHQGEGRPLLAPMPWPSVAAMTDEDLKAVYAYLRSIKPIANTVPDPKVPPPVIEEFGKNNAALVELLKGGPPAPKPAPGAAVPKPPPGAPAPKPAPSNVAPHPAPVPAQGAAAPKPK
jgi:hypothetical protein